MNQKNLKSTTLRLCTGLALIAAPTLMGPQGCPGDPGGGEVCPSVYSPVCGTDSVTYGNPCEADRAGVRVAHEGACLEAYCPTVYAPVCGDDGNTYGNDCEAHRAGVEIASAGACACPPVYCAALIACEFGYATNAAGCETCECNPPPACLPVLCDLHCEDGFAVDEHGCETCACNPPRTACTSDSECGAGESCLLSDCAQVCDPSAPEGECFTDCGAGVCVPREEPTCSSDADCGEGAFCDIIGCLGVGPGEGCGDDPTCGGYCRPLPPPPVETCYADDDCSAGALCDLSACDSPHGEGAIPSICIGTCRPSTPPPSSCETDVECGEGAHCERIACAAICAEGSDCDWSCPGGMCVIDTPPPPPATSCETDLDCDAGQACLTIEVEVMCVRAPCPPVLEGRCAWIADAI